MDNVERLADLHRTSIVLRGTAEPERCRYCDDPVLITIFRGSGLCSGNCAKALAALLPPLAVPPSSGGAFDADGVVAVADPPWGF